MQFVASKWNSVFLGVVKCHAFDSCQPLFFHQHLMGTLLKKKVGESNPSENIHMLCHSSCTLEGSKRGTLNVGTLKVYFNTIMLSWWYLCILDNMDSHCLYFIDIFTICLFFFFSLQRRFESLTSWSFSFLLLQSCPIDLTSELNYGSIIVKSQLQCSVQVSINACKEYFKL